jgi:hypothetical protein
MLRSPRYIHIHASIRRAAGTKKRGQVGLDCTYASTTLAARAFFFCVTRALAVPLVHRPSRSFRSMQIYTVLMYVRADVVTVVGVGASHASVLNDVHAH